MEAPFIPQLVNEEDTQYFSSAQATSSVTQSFVDIQGDIEVSRRRSMSFGPEILREIIHEKEIDDDFSNFPLTSISNLAQSTMRSAKQKKGRTCSFDATSPPDRPQMQPVRPLPSKLTKRTIQSTTPIPKHLTSVKNKNKIKRMSYENPY